VLSHVNQLLLGILDHFLSEGKASLGIFNLLGLVGLILRGPFVGLGGRLVALVHCLEGIDEGRVANGRLGLGKVDRGGWRTVLFGLSFGVGGPSPEGGDGGGELGVSLEKWGSPVVRVRREKEDVFMLEREP